MIKLGVIGVGSMGRNHLRVAKELNQCFDVIGFYDASPEQTEKIEQTFNVKGFDNVEELLEKVDACIIAAPSSLHKEIGLLAAKHKVHTLMEKPICLTSKDGLELEKAFKDLTFMVSHVERYNPAVHELSKIIDDEEIIAIEIHRCSPFDKRIFDTNVIFDLMIHDVDILINEFKLPKIKVMTAYANNKISKRNFDYVQAIFKYENDVVCSIVASRSTEDKIRTINVHTKTKYVTGDLLNKKVTITRRTNFIINETHNYKQDNIVETIMLPFVEPLKAEILDFYECIVENKVPKTNAHASIEALKLCEEIDDICEQGR